MPNPNVKLAQSLVLLAALQAKGLRAIRSDMLTRTHRERLVKAGYLEDVLKGWYLSARPGEVAGSTASWFAGMRDFVSGYCDERFGAEWHLSPEQTLLLRSGQRSLPAQLQVWTRSGNNQLVALPHGCSLFLYRAPKLWPARAEAGEGGLRLIEPAPALVAVGPGFFSQQPMAATIALGLVTHAAELLQPMLDGSHSVVAGRLAGALRSLGREDMANDIVHTMRSADYVVNEHSPFDAPPEALPGGRSESPYVQRLRLTWTQMRSTVAALMPAPGPVPSDIEWVLSDLESRYVSDAYHSLSIEGYRVTPELIERVRTGQWSPDGADQGARDAMAAKGYFEAHQRVKAFVAESLKNQSTPCAMQCATPDVLREAVADWYRALFGPSVQAGLLKASDLAGWRNEQVFIRGAMHVPLPKEAVRDCMPVLFELMATESHPGVRAVLGHFLFVYIHPYMDGNGRLGRFLMNAMLASGGYVWTVVPVQQRDAYMAALEKASSGHDIADFAAFIGQLVVAQSAAPLQRPL